MSERLERALTAMPINLEFSTQNRDYGISGDGLQLELIADRVQSEIYLKLGKSSVIFPIRNGLLCHKLFISTTLYLTLT